MSEVSLASSLLEFAPGAIGGCANVVVGYPMDLIKVRQQSTPTAAAAAASAPSRTAVAATLVGNGGSSSSSTAGMLRNIIAKDGVSGLYRGIASPLLAVTPAFAVSFWSCDLAKSFIVDYENKQQRQQQHEVFTQQDLSIAQIAAAGGFSGIPLAMVIGPSERLKCLMQVDKQRYSGVLDCCIQLYREGGISSIFRGTGSAVLRDVPGNAAYFAGYEFFKRQFTALEQQSAAAGDGQDYYSANAKPSTPSILLAGGLAGVANWIVALPFDTVKSRIQTAPAGKYKNYMDVVRQTVQKEGVQALFRGLTPALLRAFPSNAACLLGVETARSFMEGMR